jgi:hypothetical protein
MVLHLHRSEPSWPSADGPAYDWFESSSGLITNDPPLQVDIMYAATMHGLWLRLLIVHAYDAVQGAETAAAAKLEKKNEDESNAARTPRSDMITD